MYGMVPMYVLIIFLGGIVINTTAYHLGRYSLHLLPLKSSMSWYINNNSHTRELNCLAENLQRKVFFSSKFRDEKFHSTNPLPSTTKASNESNMRDGDINKIGGSGNKVIL